MINEKKDLVMILTAILTLVSGIAMSFFSFFLSEEHIIADSVLWYFAQCLVYAGSAFGIAAYVHMKIKDIGSIIYEDNKKFHAGRVDRQRDGHTSQHKKSTE